MAFSPFERLVALRYLRARRKEGFVSVIAGFSLAGIALGVATLIIVMSVMNGFRQELLGRILGLNGHIGVYGYGGSLVDYDMLAEAVRTMPGVTIVTPTIEGQVMATANNVASGAVVRGVKPEDIRARPVIAEALTAGSLDDFTGLDTVLIGARMAERFALVPGAKIKLISPKGNATAFGTVPRVQAFTVAAIFDVGMYEYDNSFIYMPMEAAQVYFKLPNQVTHLEILTRNPDDMGELRQALLAYFQQGARILAWQQTNSSFFNALQVERNVMFLILMLIILVAALNMISGLIMMVKDKGRDIAILRTMGATKGMILRIFFLSGASVGVVGTTAGVLLGLVFCDNIEAIRQFIQALSGTDLFSAEIYFLSRIPAEVDPAEVWTVVIMALGLSFGATIYPAWRASKLDPVEALRYE